MNKSTVENENHQPKRRSKIARIKITSLIFLVLGLGLIGFAGLNMWQRQTATVGTTQPPDYNTVVTEDAAEPEEKKPDMTAEYSVAPDKPRRIMIDKIGANGFIQQVGTTKENAMAVPSNIHIAGWFVDGVAPGQKGLSIIDGHVSGKYSNGIFYDLKKLEVGDRYQVEFGDKSTKTFEVVEKKQLAEKDSAEYLFQKNDSIEAQLNLVTCGGKFDSKTETYEDRIIIVSKLVD